MHYIQASCFHQSLRSLLHKAQLSKALFSKRLVVAVVPCSFRTCNLFLDSTAVVGREDANRSKFLDRCFGVDVMNEHAPRVLPTPFQVDPIVD